MQNTPPPPRPSRSGSTRPGPSRPAPTLLGLALPRRLLDDAWWLAAALADPPGRVIPFPDRPARPARPGGPAR